MAEKRKDSRGRLLKDGEVQRSDGSYMFRYTDIHRKRKYVYSRSLEELRKKEDIIRRDLFDGIDYAAGETTVYELAERYLKTKKKLSENTRRAYGIALTRIKIEDFGEKRICDVKKSDAKLFFLSLHDSGLKQNTIEIFQTLLRPAFEMAVDDDMIRKNPFKFHLSEFIPDDADKRNALTKAQQTQYLNFIHTNGDDNYYYDIVILLGTGLRISELYGLTKKDVNMKDRCIYIDKQLCRTAEQPYFIKEPKTKSGIRCIPMTEPVYYAFKHVLDNRPKPRIEKTLTGTVAFSSWTNPVCPRLGCISKIICETCKRSISVSMEVMSRRSRPMCCGTHFVRTPSRPG